MTEPPVGAWVCASGSHVCTGNSGTLTANAMAKREEQPPPGGRREVGVVGDLDEVERDVADAVALARTAVAMMPTSMNAEPTIVNRKNFVAA